MALFNFGVPIETEEPAIAVEFDAANPLPPGQHRIQLICMDDAQNESAPAIHTFVVMDTERPNAIIDGPSRVVFNQPFKLSGERSFDVGGGRIVLYRWTLLD